MRYERRTYDDEDEYDDFLTDEDDDELTDSSRKGRRDEDDEDDEIYLPPVKPVSRVDKAKRAPRRVSAAQIRKRKRADKTRIKTSFAIFYIVTLLIGVFVMVMLFIFVSGNLPETVIPPLMPELEVTAPVLPEGERFLAMVEDIIVSGTRRAVTLRFIEFDRVETLTLTDTSTITNRFGNIVPFSEVTLGQILEAQYNQETREIRSLSLNSARAWNRSFAGGLRVDYNGSTIAIGSEIWRYSSRTLFLARGEIVSITALDPNDVVTIWGYGEHIWSLSIDEGSGVILLENINLVRGGRIQVPAASIFAALDSSRTFSLREGQHRIIIEGDNIVPFVVDVISRRGETSVVNLANVEFREVNLAVAVTPQDADLFLNGERIVPQNGRITVEFSPEGVTHSLRAEATGFLPAVQEFEIVSGSPLRIKIPGDDDILPEPLRMQLVRETVHHAILVETIPPGAQIFINHGFMGESPVVLDLQEGTHLLTARLAGYQDSNLNISVHAASSRQYLLPLVSVPVVNIPEMPPVDPNVPVLPPLPPDYEPVPPPPLPEYLPPPSDVWPPPASELPTGGS